jgi:hypothetical protein
VRAGDVRAHEGLELDAHFVCLAAEAVVGGLELVDHVRMGVGRMGGGRRWWGGGVETVGVDDGLEALYICLELEHEGINPSVTTSDSARTFSIYALRFAR